MNEMQDPWLSITEICKHLGVRQRTVTELLQKLRHFGGGLRGGYWGWCERQHLNSNAPRKEYARKAKVMAKGRHMLVEVLGDEARWKKLAVKIKQDHLRRSAFYQEFADVVPGWSELE